MISLPARLQAMALVSRLIAADTAAAAGALADAIDKPGSAAKARLLAAQRRIGAAEIRLQMQPQPVEVRHA